MSYHTDTSISMMTTGSAATVWTIYSSKRLIQAIRRTYTDKTGDGLGLVAEGSKSSMATPYIAVPDMTA